MSLAGLAEKEAGNQAFKEGDVEKAIYYYSQAVEANPTEATFLSNRSAAYHKLGKFQKAVEDAMKCIELRPEWPKGYYRLGEGYFGRGLFAKASDAYSKALDLEPSDVGVREALARAEKALYNRVLEEGNERREEGAPAEHKPAISNLMTYDSDDESPVARGYERRGSAESNSSLNNSTSAERHKEIMNRRLAQGTGITSIEDYMKYRSAGGSKIVQDTTTNLVNTQNPEIKPTQSRSELLKSLGIDADSPRSSNAADTPSPRSSTNGGPTFQSYDPASSKKAELAKKRAEFLASINMNGSMPNAGASDSSWSRIASSDRLPAQPMPGSHKSAGDDDDAWRPSSVSTVNSEELRGTPPLPKRERTPPLHGRRSGRGSETPPDTPPRMGSSYAMPQGPPDPLTYGRNAAAARGRSADETKEDEEEDVDTTSLATVAVMSASVAANHPLFANLQSRAQAIPMDGGSSYQPGQDKENLRKKYSGVGDGEQISRNWMQEFRAKKEAGEAVKANGDEKVVELKQTYGDFHYRQYKESTADDEETKKTHLSNAITAEALAGYDYGTLK
jgi:tetratricopeptide (TPR) repeat protein|mmetsp:Transcript_14283/g.22796  ORF Transcript_14283/g.22796 Transcript_14283/m.22796 type:complete len:562 (-) Transcript_14283:241-1926(-)